MLVNLFQVGDIVSVIDMPPKELTSWWRGKHGFQVGTSTAMAAGLEEKQEPQCCVPGAAMPHQGVPALG